jgi:hypothetical protein
MRWCLAVLALSWSTPALAGETSQVNTYTVVVPTFFTVTGLVTFGSEPMAGVTIVATDTRTNGQTTTSTDITSESGAFTLMLPAGRYDITAYYLDVTATIGGTTHVIAGDTTLPAIDVADWPSQDRVCIPLHGPSAELAAIPHHGVTAAAKLTPSFRDRTHRSMIALVAAANPATSVTTVEHGARFSRAPGIPVAFVEESVTHSLRYASDLGAGRGGATEVSLKSGSNEPQGLARLVFGSDRGVVGAAEMLASGPLRRDKAWIVGGLAARRGADDEIDGDAMLRFTAFPTAHHVLDVSALGHAAGDGSRAGWANASWGAQLHEHRLALRGVTTVETLRAPAELAARAPAETPLPEARSVDRAGGTLAARYRFEAGGYHQLSAIAGGGGGTRGDTRHADGSFAIEDDWLIASSVTVIAGVRTSVRRFGDEQATVVAPRATLQWDPSKEGRQQIFLHYQRVSHLDDGLPGDWRNQPRFHEELAGGIAHMRSMGRTMIGISGRVRIPERIADEPAEPKLGGDLWLRYEGDRTIVFGQATSLDRVATLLAQRKVIDRGRSVVALGASTRITEDEQQLGTALAWSRRGEWAEGTSARALSTELAIEAYSGSAGPGGRLLLGIIW